MSEEEIIIQISDEIKTKFGNFSNPSEDRKTELYKEIAEFTYNLVNKQKKENK